MIAENKRLLSIWSVCGGLLLLPLVAMQFTTEVNWNLPDFLVAGVLLFGTGLAIEVALRKFKEQKYRSLIIFGIVLLAILLFMEMAVGIFGSPIAGS